MLVAGAEQVKSDLASTSGMVASDIKHSGGALAARTGRTVMSRYS